MSVLFETTTINNIEMANRFVRSATWEGLAAEDGSVTDRLLGMYTELAAGGVGVIITGHAFVSEQGRACPWQLGIHDDNISARLTRLTDAVHRHGGKIVVQLAHAGCRAAVDLTGIEPIGPSVLTGESGQVCRKMDAQDIANVVAAFSRAAGRARKAGFDGVQIHAAHSYLISEFFSPCHNTRDDAYGGSIENRSRLLLEVISGIRAEVGSDFALLVKINCDDFIEGGFTPDQMLAAAALMENHTAGVDAIEISGGSPFSPLYMAHRPGPIKSEEEEVYYRVSAQQYKKKIHIPLILPGGIRSFSIARNIVEEGVADYVSMSRPLIREPDLINRWQSGDLRKAACLTDNLCLGPLKNGAGLYCVIADRKDDS